MNIVQNVRKYVIDRNRLLVFPQWAFLYLIKSPDCFCHYVISRHTFQGAEETFPNYYTISIEISAYFNLKLSARKGSLNLYQRKLGEIVFTKVKESGELVLAMEFS